MRWWLLGLAAGCGGDPGDASPTDTATLDPSDGDGDGAGALDDCDDADPTVHPGAEERCDGLDTDCDPATDDPVGVVGRSDGGNHASIGEAVAAAGAGATVWICGGTWTENVEIDRDLALVGLGEVTIDARGAGAGVTVTSGTVSLSGFDVVDGAGSPVGSFATNGGGIDGFGATGPLAVGDVRVSGSRAELAGGILVGPAGGTLTDVEVEGNEATRYGGGIYAAGPVTLVRVTLRGNTAGEYGGGLALSGEGDVAELDDVVVEANTAHYGGGLFTFQDGAFRLTDTAIRANTADAGGGAYLWAGALSGGEVSGNVADDGGGIVVYDGGALDGVLVSGNTADNGAGLHLGGAVTLAATTVELGAATSDGGGAWVADATVIADEATVLTGNTALRGGGAVLVDSAWTGGRFAAGEAQDGGGIYVSGSGEGASALSGVIVEDNVASSSGGGVFAGGDFALADATVRRNLSQDRGGGLYTTFQAAGSVDRAVFLGNTAVARGGGLYPNDGSTLVVRDSELRANVAARGAGIYVFGASDARLTRCVVEANGDATTVSGGGARVTDGALHSDATGWGDGATDNLPDDLYVEGGQQAYSGYTAAETFDCDAQACSPTP